MSAPIIHHHHRRVCLAVVASLLLLSSLPTTGMSQYPPHQIASRHHVPNPRGGYCGWASTETLARSQGWTDRIAGLTAQRVRQTRHGGSWPSQWRATLSARGIPYVAHVAGTYRMPTAAPSVVSLRPAPGRRHGHAVIHLGSSGSAHYLYDPNHPGRVTTMSGREWRSRWEGNALMIWPRR